MLQTEMIGKVTMNYKHYTGVDAYSDGAVEDELLDIVISHSPAEYATVIEQKASWPVFYHLSEQRGNIVEWMPIPVGAKVLEVGSGCGAITSALSAKGADITCVELSKKRSLINANRNRDRDNITIHVGNFREIEPELDRDYAFIFLIGVFEYGEHYIGTDHPFEHFLYLLQRHLGPSGRIVIAIENLLGLKYFAGCKEDHAGTYFTGIEGYKAGDPARTFSRNTLIRIMRNAGITEYSFYYPYPDYKFMNMLHSDQHLPREGEFMENVRNYDRDRMVLFNEKYAYDALIRDRMYPEFANSFEVVIGPAFPTIYVKYSNDRADDFKIRTEIVLDSLGRMLIHKHPLTLSARDHVRGMSDAYTALADRYRGGDISINDCQLDETGYSAIFSFVNGVTLSSMMDACLQRGDLAGFDNLFKEYLRRISYREDYPAADYDLVFSNILVNGPIWTVIDYEWTYGKRIATRDVAFRALYCYVLEDNKRSVIDMKKYCDYLGLDDAHIEQLKQEEADFQKYVTGGRKAMVELWKMFNFATHRPSMLDTDSALRKDRIQVYVNRGKGFREEDSYFPDAQYDEEGRATISLSMEAGVESMRLDPAFAPCITTIKRTEWNGKPIEASTALYQPNGAWLSDESIVFQSDDPCIEITPNAANLTGFFPNTLLVEIQTALIAPSIANDLYEYQMNVPEETEAPAAPAPAEGAATGAATVGAAASTSAATAAEQPAVQVQAQPLFPLSESAFSPGGQQEADKPDVEKPDADKPGTGTAPEPVEGSGGTKGTEAPDKPDGESSDAAKDAPETSLRERKELEAMRLVRPDPPDARDRDRDRDSYSYRDREREIEPDRRPESPVAREMNEARKRYFDAYYGDEDSREYDRWEEANRRRKRRPEGKKAQPEKRRRRSVPEYDEGYDDYEDDVAYDEDPDFDEDDFDAFEDFDDDDFYDDSGRGLFSRLARKKRR